MAKSKRLKSAKPTLIAIENWSQADDCLRAIGSWQAKINLAEQTAKEDIDEIKAGLVAEVKPLKSQIDQLVRSLEAFCVANKKDFGRKRSKRLTFGILGWRKSSSISITKQTLELVKQVFGRAAKRFIHIKEAVDKEALAKLTDEQLSSLKAKRKVRDDFFAEPEAMEITDRVL